MPIKDFAMDLINAKKIQGELAKLYKESPEFGKKAVRSTMTAAKKQIPHIIASFYTVDNNDMKKAMTGQMKGVMDARIRVRSRRLTLAHFRYFPTTPGSGTVRAEVLRGRIKRVPSAFVASTGAKSAGKTPFNVFRRTPDPPPDKVKRDPGLRRTKSGKVYVIQKLHSLPIETVPSISIAQMVAHSKVAPQIKKQMQSGLKTSMEKAVAARLKKLKGGK